jgi:hypothetical protein
MRMYPLRARSHRGASGYDRPSMEDDIIEQAQARVAAQLGCSLERALEVITDTARATDETIEHLAAEVVAGRLTFD